MKKTAVLAMAMLLLLSACADNRREERQLERVQEESGEAMNVTAKYLEGEAKDAREALEAGMKDLDQEIERLKAESKDAAEDARPEIEAQKQSLEALKRDATKQLDELEAVSKENWQELKRDAAVFQENMNNAAEESRNN